MTDHLKTLTKAARETWFSFSEDDRFALSSFNYEARGGAEVIRMLLEEYRAQAEVLAGIVYTLRFFAENYQDSFNRLHAKGLLSYVDATHRQQAQAVIEKVDRLIESCTLPKPGGDYHICDGVFPDRDRHFCD